MDVLWSPWRSHYVSSEKKENGCVFCRLAEDRGPDGDRENHILHRGRYNYIVLNLFPYTSGHALIIPYAHLPLLADAEKPVTDEMMDLAKVFQQALGETYHPQGFNLGMNLGAAAGAGVAAHFHLHIMPRWAGDANFMTTVGEVRVMPETLADSWSRLKKFF
jgi:ATP adenylyltransferase